MTEPKLRFPAIFCENLQFSAKSCGFLWFPAPSKCLSFQWNSSKGKSAVFCENLRLGSLCHLGSVPFKVKRTLKVWTQRAKKPSFTSPENTLLGAGGRFIEEGGRTKILLQGASNYTPALRGPVRDTPPYRAIPFRDSIAEGGIAPISLVFIGYRAGIAEIPLLRGGVSHLHFANALQGGNAQKRGEGVLHPIGHVETPKTP